VLENDSDPEGDALSITGVTQGFNGSVSHTGSSLSYTPKAGGVGSYSYSYSDGRGGTATATVSIDLGGGGKTR